MGESKEEKRVPHLLVVVAPFRGHATPLLELLYQLADSPCCRAVRVTVVCDPRCITELSELKSRGDFEGLEMRLEDVFREPEPICDHPLYPARSSSTEIWKPEFQQYVKTFKQETHEFGRPTCILSDMFFYWTQDAAEELGIPWYMLFPVASWFPLICLILPTLQLNDDTSNNSIPGLTFGRLRQIFPDIVDDPGFVARIAETMGRASALFLNTAEELDAPSGGLDSVRSLLKSMAGGKNTAVPRVLPIGPMVRIPGFSSSKLAATESTADCLRYLDTQAESSVLYIAFGSVANISPESVLELAHALELTEVAFLWALKTSTTSADLSTILPPNFQSLTKQRGFIETGWVPQHLVLEHASIGGFLSHCGWNSTIEGICSQVPFITWPISNDQLLNARFLVDVLKVGVEICPQHESLDDVKRDALARAISLVMIEESQTEVRKNCEKLMRLVKTAVAKDGSSHRALHSFFREIST